MKKLLCVLAAATLLITSAACSAEKPVTTPEETEASSVQTTEAAANETTQAAAEVTTEETSSSLSAEEAVEIFLANKDTWEFEEMAEYEGFYYYFLDLDLDGVCELVTSNYAGSGCYSYNKYYKIDTETKTVKELVSDEEDMGGYDFESKDELKLLKSKKDGSINYYCMDYMREGHAYNCTTYYTIRLDGEKITGTEVSAVEHEESMIDQTSTDTFYFYKDGKKTEVSVDEEIALREEFFDGYENLNLKHVELNAQEFKAADAEEQKQLILYGYNGFYYSK